MIQNLIKLSFLFLLVWGLIGCTPCHNRVRDRVDSPSGDYRAILFDRICSDRGFYSTQVSLVPANHTELNNAPGNVFIALVPSEVEIRWQGEQLQILTDVALDRVAKQEKERSGVVISYRYPSAGNR